jgi:hypothetical protein
VEFEVFDRGCLPQRMIALVLVTRLKGGEREPQI